MISFTVINIGLLSYSPVLGLTNIEVETVNTSSLKLHSPFDASTIAVFATFEPRLMSNCVRFVPLQRAHGHMGFVLVRFPSFRFHQEFTAARGTSGTTGAFTREHLFCVFVEGCDVGVRTLHKALARPFQTKMCRKRGRALFFFRSWQRIFDKRN